MKTFLVCTLFVISVFCEPPVDNRYLPPTQGYRTTNQDRFTPPSQSYGAPGGQPGPQRQTDAVFRNRPSSAFGGPRSEPSSQYGPPNRSQMRRPSSQYGPPSEQNQPSNQYGPPSQFSQNQAANQFGRQNQPSNQYGPPSLGQNQPSNQYGPPSLGQNQPSNQYGPPSLGQNQPSNQFGRQNQPSNQYGPPSLGQNQPSNQFGRQNQPSNQYGPPSQSGRQNQPSSQYGAPGFGNQNGGRSGIEYEGPSQQYGAPSRTSSSQGFGGQDNQASRQYLPPNRRGGFDGDDEGNNEPANYSFEYMVKDDESGNDFGHRESRQGNRAEGLYYVLLPDGRKQMVEYEADENGYKPKISYEDTGLGRGGGYDRNSQDLGRGNQGYQSEDYQNGQSGPY